MKNNPTLPPVLHQPTEEEIRDYAFHLYEQSNCEPGRDLDNWLEAIDCLKAEVPHHLSASHLHARMSREEASGFRAEAIAKNS
ncbi:MAG: DUF2934 domain-containing protein [Opitutaceae bacterium]|nr:DUF2934 domain-containing protein [Opitutaceae bacterium]